MTAVNTKTQHILIFVQIKKKKVSIRAINCVKNLQETFDLIYFTVLCRLLICKDLGVGGSFLRI